MYKSNNTIIIAMAIMIISLAGWVGYLLVNQENNEMDSVTDFTRCVAAGNPVMESYPRQCRSKNGVNYTEIIDNPVETTKTFKSDKGIELRINNWSDNKQISSPLTITGEVPGNWSFEASFPVVVVDWDGLIIGEKSASLQGDWMTADYVPFSITIEFDTPTVNKSGAIILRKDNPSGLPENDDAVEIPITYNP